MIIVELLVALLGAVFGGAALSMRRHARPPVMPQPQAKLGRPFVPDTVSRSRRNPPLRWVPYSQSLAIGDFYIPSGMIYVSDGEPAVEEASNINLRLPVGQPVRSPAAQLNHCPQYRWLSPDQRATYLAWLAAGRKDEAPASRELGYIFLFFYGLERRLLVEKAQDQEAVAEIVRLIYHYGPYTRSKSLHNYGCQLIHFWGWKQGVEYYAQLLQWMKTLPVSLLGEDEWAIVLASHFLSSKPLPPELGYELVSRDPEARRSVVFSRFNEEFRALFSRRYLERFPGGLGLQSANRKAQLYRPASPTLLLDGWHDGFSILVPDVLGVQSQFKPLLGIWNSCVADLKNVSRAKGRAPAPAARVAAETIPAPGQPFHLDMSRVEKIARETQVVQEMLAKVMVEEPQESQARPAAQVRPALQASRVLASPETAFGPTPERLKYLDPKYHPVLKRLMERDSWARRDFDELVKGFQLMPLDAQDAIREWSDDHLGDFLLEGDDPILIHKTLIQ